MTPKTLSLIQLDTHRAEPGGQAGDPRPMACHRVERNQESSHRFEVREFFKCLESRRVLPEWTRGEHGQFGLGALSFGLVWRFPSVSPPPQTPPRLPWTSRLPPRLRC